MDDPATPRIPPEVRSGDPAEVVEWLAADLEPRAREALAERDRFAIAIPGGSVATTCFPRLAAVPLDWSRAEIFWVDERAVPPDHADSNHRLARALWLEPAGVPAGRIHRMPVEAVDLDRAAREYAETLTAVVGDPPRLDYVLLGVGPDGHVASLFPGHPALAREGPVLAIEDAPAPLPRRLSLSLPVLTRARRLAIVAFGAAKAPVVREALEMPDSPLPVARVARESRRCLFILDRAAAGRG